MNLRLLAFDTSTESMSVALHANGRHWQADAPGGAQTSQQLIPCIRGLLAQADLPMQQLQAIAFGRGPGAFTGLRAACAVAQGLAFGLGVPVLPVDSLMIVAEQARLALAAADDEALDIDVVMDARMAEVYAGTYRWRAPRWQASVAPALYTLDALHARWAQAPPRFVAGSALAIFGERLHAGPARRIEDCAPRSHALLLLARQLWADGAAVPAAAALPLYLRDKVALTTAQRADMASTAR